jgi:hypothetical protein
LLSNPLIGILSAKPNDDPFFLTQPTPNNQKLFNWGQPAGLLVCREQMRLHVRHTANHPKEYTSNDVVAVGRYEEVAEKFKSYLEMMQNWNPKLARTLETDWNLFAASAETPSIRFALDGLSGRALRAADTLQVGGVQMGDPANVTTRAEVTRWFAVAMLYRVYSARIFTSGADNDWGFGVLPIASLEGKEHWVCSTTLRTSTTYKSLNLSALICLGVLSFCIILASFTLKRILLFIVRRFSGAGRTKLKRALLAKNLRAVLQLHRIAVEKTYGHRFSDTAGSIPVGEAEAPIYGVKADEEFADEDQDMSQVETLFTADGYDSMGGVNPDGRTMKRGQYATMLRADEDDDDDYDIRKLR